MHAEASSLAEGSAGQKCLVHWARPQQEFRKLVGLRERHDDIGMKFCLNLVRSMKV